MKIILAVAFCALLTGAHAGAFTDTLKNIGTGIQSVFTDMVNNLKEPATQLGHTLIDNLVSSGGQLLATGASSLVNSLSHLGSTSRRDLAAIPDVAKFLQEGNQEVSKLANAVGTIFQAAMSGFHELSQKITSMQFLQEPLDHVLEDIAKVVDVHSILQSGVLKTLTEHPGEFLLHAAQGLMSSMSHKRNDLANVLSALGNDFISLFKPVIQKVTEYIHSLGTTLTEAATNLFHSVQPTLHEVGTNLFTHVKALKDSTQELLTNGQEVLKNL